MKRTTACAVRLGPSNPQEARSTKLQAPFQEKRCVPRHTCCTDLHLVYEGFPRQIDLRLPDISPQGMFINTPQCFAEGTTVKIRFRLGNSGKLVHARGEVRYCLPGVGIGVEFVDMRQEDRTAIAEESCTCGPEW